MAKGRKPIIPTLNLEIETLKTRIAELELELEKAKQVRPSIGHGPKPVDPGGKRLE